MKQNKILAKGILIILVTTVVAKCFGYVYKIIASRWLGVEKFGMLSLGLALFMLMGGILFQGINIAINRNIAFYNGKKDYATVKKIIRSGRLLVFLISIVTAILLFFTAGIIESYTKKEGISLIIRILAIMMPFYAIILTIESIFEGFQRIDLSAISKILLDVSKVVGVIASVIIGVKLVGVSVSLVLATVSTSVIMLVLYKKKISNKIKEIETNNNLWSLFSTFRYSLPLMATVLVHTLMTWGDTIILGFFRTVREVGVYSIILPTANLLSIPVIATNTALGPLISNLFSQKKEDEVLSVYKRATKWMLMLMLPILIVIILFPKRIIYTLAGSDFISGYGSLVIIAIGVFIGSLGIAANAVLLAINKLDLMMKNSFIASIINILLNIILIPKYGIIGISIAILLSNITLFILRLYTTKKIIKVYPLSNDMIKISLMGILTAVTVYGINDIANKMINYDAIMLMINAISTLIIFYGLLYVSKSFDSVDKEIVNAIMRRVGLK